MAIGTKLFHRWQSLLKIGYEMKAIWEMSAKRFVPFICLGLFLALRVWDPAPLEVLRVRTFDFYQNLHPREFTPQPIVIVDLDEESLAEVGQWPWPRTVISDMVANICDSGAAVIGFDIVFAEPDRMSPAKIAGTLHGLTPEVKDNLLRLPSNDQVLANTLKRCPVVLGQAGYFRKIERESADLIKTSIAEIGGDPRPFLINFIDMVRNVPVLDKAGKGHGMFTLTPETDSVVRRVPALLRVGEAIFPTLTIEMLRVATGQKSLAAKSDNLGLKGVMVAKRLIPTDNHGRIWVHYAPNNSQRYVSAKNTLNGTLAKDFFSGKLVFIGTSAAGLLDIKSTPVNDAMPGVEIHAQLLETILSNAYLTRPGNAIGAEFSVALVSGLLMIFLMPLLGARWTLVLFVLVTAVLSAGSWYLYVEKAALYDVTFATLSTFLLYSLLTYANYSSEEAQRKQVRTAFSHYLSPAMVEKLAEDPSHLVLGGETKDMTLLFCDIRGFTAISEQFDAEELTNFINRFLTPMTDIIMSHGGTVDKYMGDAIMAFWNAPLDDPDHAKHASIAGMEMIKTLGELNTEWEAKAKEVRRKYIPVKIGVGVNSGPCCVGNMGSDQRFDYSVLGDDVNLASRLEGQSKTYGVEIVVGENTEKLINNMAMVELDLIQVKGKTMPVHIHALLGDQEFRENEGFSRLATSHNDMISAYRRQDWKVARGLINTCREINGEATLGLSLDVLYSLYEERMAQFKEIPPDDDWDGIFVATIK
jgi:adenylate cyclase